MLKIEAKIFHTIHGYVSFDKAFNFCNYLRVRKSNMFIRLIGAEIEKGINFPIKCPFKKVKEVELKNNQIIKHLLYFRVNTILIECMSHSSLCLHLLNILMFLHQD